MNQFLTSLENNLRERKKLALTRQLKIPEGLDFCSNDYLCLSSHKSLKKVCIDTIEHFGFGSTSSRFIRGEHGAYKSFENDFAKFKNCERALMFSSGYAANIGVLTSLINKDDVVFSDRLNHASIIDGLRLSGAQIIIYDHLSMDDLQKKIRSSPVGKNKFLVSESLFSMDGDIAPLDQLASICENNSINLILDESHSAGIFGSNGAGLADQFAVQKKVLCSISGLGKAFGCFGGVVCANEIVIEHILQNARTLMFSTALPTSNIFAAHKALELVSEGNYLRQKLRENVFYFKKQLEHLLPNTSQNNFAPILPIVLRENKLALDCAKSLQNSGFDVRAIRPPSVLPNESRLRITTNVDHDQKTINKFCSVLLENL